MPDGRSEELAIARWRTDERRRLIDARLAVPAATRRAFARVVAGRLDELLSGVSDPVVSLY